MTERPHFSLTPPILSLPAPELKDPMSVQFVALAKEAASQGEYAFAIDALINALFDTERQGDPLALQARTLRAVWGAITFHASISFNEATTEAIEHCDQVVKQKQALRWSRGISKKVKERFRRSLKEINDAALKLADSGRLVAELCDCRTDPFTRSDLEKLRDRLSDWRT